MEPKALFSEWKWLIVIDYREDALDFIKDVLPLLKSHIFNKIGYVYHVQCGEIFFTLILIGWILNWDIFLFLNFILDILKFIFLVRHSKKWKSLAFILYFVFSQIL